MAEGRTANGRNLLLDALTDGQAAVLMPSLELVSLGLRHMLYEPDALIEHVYFPVNGVHSMLALLENDLEIEVGTVGNEGMIGLPLFLGTEMTPGRAFSQVPGYAYRLSAAAFKDLIREPSRMTAVLHRYTQALMVQISQSTACNRVHSDDRRCARWLLQTHDRVGEDEFMLPLEFLAQMLGVQPTLASEIAARFEAGGIIRYSRDIVRVLDRGCLEEASCNCYWVIRKEYDRMYSELKNLSN